MKKKLAVFMSVLLISSSNVMAAVNDDGPTGTLNINGPEIMLDGEFVEAAAVIADGETYVPLRDVLQKMGCIIKWNKDTKTAEIFYKDKTITFSAFDGDNTIMINNKMYIPLRKTVEFFGAEIQWRQADDEMNINTGTVIIETKSKGGFKIIGVDDTSSFAVRLNNIMPKEKNYMFSPFSLKYALAMAASGADETVSSELTGVLGISDLEQFNNNVREYLEEHKFEFVANPDGRQGSNYGINLDIANSVWLNEDYVRGGDFSEKYKKLVEEKYNAAAEKVNNNNAVEKINNWCYEKTNHKISNIIDNSDFQACLVNTVYFNGKWNISFSEENTKKDIFTDRNGRENNIDFMTQNENVKYNYYEDDVIKLLALPYNSQGGQISMYIALTDNENVDFEKYIDKMSQENVNVSIPKFKTEYSFSAKEFLERMGVDSAFDDKKPHFAPMFNDAVNNKTNIFIADVLQKAFISIDEKGTEAAAVSSIIQCGITSMRPKPEKIYEFKANKPFTYFVRDDNTGEVIFMGSYSFVE